MNLQKLIALSVISMIMSLWFSWIGDDDVVYKFLDRKPTIEEAIAWARFVFSKFFASMYGGGLIALVLAQHVIKDALSINISKFQFVCFLGLCIALCSLIIGVIQNLIRLLQGRQQRPIFDLALVRKQWSGKRR